MKLKYFLRGLGLGISVTALVLGLSYKNKLSDEAVILNAKKLGMVFEEKETETTEEPVIEQTDQPVEQPVDQPVEQPVDQPVEQPVDQPVEQPVEQPVDQPVEQPVDQPEEQPKDKKKTKKKKSDKVSFSIKEGEWSAAVSRKLEKLGLIKKATDFDDYLDDNGYSEYIKIGKYKISKKASYKEIAETITGK